MEPLLLVHDEKDYIALNIVGQFWLANYILSCDEPPSGEVKANGEAQLHHRLLRFGRAAALLPR